MAFYNPNNNSFTTAPLKLESKNKLAEVTKVVT